MPDGTPRYPVSPQDTGILQPDNYAAVVAQPLTESGNPFLDAVYAHPAFFVEGYQHREGFVTVRRDMVVPPQFATDFQVVAEYFKLKLNRTSETTTSGTVDVTQDQVEGHFGHGLPSLFQGHNSLRYSILTLGATALGANAVGRLVAARNLQFTGMAKLGETVRFDAEMINRVGGLVRGKANGFNVSKGDRPTMSVEELVVDTELNKDGEGMPPNRILEGALQTAGIAALEGIDPSLLFDEIGALKVLPLFKSVEELQFTPTIIRPGDRLIYVPYITQHPELSEKRQTGRIKANIDVFRQIHELREPVGTIVGAEAPVVPAKLVFGR